jgi:hypothetical protein
VVLLGTILPDYQRLAGATAGMSPAGGVMLLACLSGTLWLMGVIAGIIAFRKIRRGVGRGRGMAWTGIVLGCLPFVILAGYLNWHAIWNGLWNEIRKPTRD